MKQLFSFALLTIFMGTALFACAEDKRKSPHETVSKGNITVKYGRPYKKGRDIFGSLVPWGEVWRTGADEATEVSFKKDMVVNGSPIKAGTYTLFTIPGEQKWEVIFNSQLKQWGAYEYDKHKGKDVLHTSVQSSALSNPVEQFTIKVEDGGIRMEWDKTGVFVPVK